MRNQVLCYLAAAAMASGTVAAEPFRYRPQPERERAWIIEAGGLFLEEARRPRRAIRLAGWQWAGQPYACAPDIAIGPRDEVVVTSNVLPVLWKIAAQSLSVSVHRLQLDAEADKDVGFSALVYSERHGAYFGVSEHTGSLWRIDPLLRRAQKIALSEPVYGACAVSIPREQRASRESRLCLHGEKGSWLLTFAPDHRSAYVHRSACSEISNE